MLVVEREAERTGIDRAEHGHHVRVVEIDLFVRIHRLEALTLLEPKIPRLVNELGHARTHSPDLPPDFGQPNPGNHHPPVDGLDHVVDRQRRHADRCQRLHLDAGLAARLDRGPDRDAGIVRAQRARSTLVSNSGWHIGTSSCVRLAAMIPATCATASGSPFLIRLVANQLDGLRLHVDPAGGDGSPGGNLLIADIDHPGPATFVEMGQCALAAHCDALLRRYAGET